MAQSLQRQVITRARELIADPRHWMQRNEHREEDGIHQYCAIGALRQAAATLLGINDKADKQVDAAVDAAAAKLALAAEPEEAAQWNDAEALNQIVVDHNDNTRHEDVLAMFDLALETV